MSFHARILQEYFTSREDFLEHKLKLFDRWYRLIFDMIKSAGLYYLLSEFGTRILEVGCGIGGFCKWASRKCDVTGLDIERLALDIANRRGKGSGSQDPNFVAGDA